MQRRLRASDSAPTYVKVRLMGRGLRINEPFFLFALTVGLSACGRSEHHPHGAVTTLAGAGGAPAGAGEAGQGGASAGASAAPSAECQPDAALAPARVLLLSDQQYQNAVFDLFGVKVTLAAAAPEMPENQSPAALEQATVMTREQVMAYHLAAGQVAKAIKPCGDAAIDATCMLQFLRDKMPRAWRRPISTDEATSVVRLFEAGAKISAQVGVDVTVSALLESGSFLYRTELGTAGAATARAVTLTPFELATAIGFAYLDSIPDEELWAKAVDGSLAKPEVLAAQADRLLELPAVRDNLRKKVSRYLGLEDLLSTAARATKDASIFPGYTQTLREGLYAGAQDFLDQLVWHGRFNDLFSSKRLYVNAEIADFYGIPGVQGGSLVAVDFDADQRRAGILSQPAWLSANSHRATGDDISHRGLSVTEAFICLGGSPPPHPTQDKDTVLGPTSVQAQWRELNSEPVCATCHGLFDPYGFATEAYDAVGRYRTLDETGAPIDTSATVRGAGPDVDGEVRDINDLAAKLSRGRRASDCGALQLTSLTLDHALERARLPCATHEIQDALASDQGGSFSALFKAIVTSPAFLMRELEAP